MYSGSEQTGSGLPESGGAGNESGGSDKRESGGAGHESGGSDKIATPTKESGAAGKTDGCDQIQDKAA